MRFKKMDIFRFPPNKRIMWEEVLIFWVGLLVGHMGSQWCTYCYPTFGWAHQFLMDVIDKKWTEWCAWTGCRKRTKSHKRDTKGMEKLIPILLSMTQSPRLMNILRQLPTGLLRESCQVSPPPPPHLHHTSRKPLRKPSTHLMTDDTSPRAIHKQHQ